jgi:hypothetical protein
MGLLSLNLPVIGQQSATEDQKVRDGLSSIQTLLNGNVDEANVPNLAAAFASWKDVLWGGAAAGATTVTGVGPWLIYGPSWANAGGAPLPVGATALAGLGFRLDPADWAANARTTKLRIRWQAIVGSTAPAATITPGLYPITGYGAANPAIASVGAVVTGSTAVFTTPAAASNTPLLSTEFNAPAAGDYVLGFASSGAFAAGSVVTVLAHLQMRQV